MSFKALEERNALIEKNLPLVARTLLELNKGKHDDDLYQVGCIGLIKAADMFDKKTQRIAFSDFARPYIERYIRSIGQDSNCVERECIVPNVASFEDDLVDLLSLGATLLERLDRQIVELRLQGWTQKEIAKSIGISQTQVSRRLKSVKERLSVS